MAEIRFKTEWLTQIALLAACGTPEDVADLCSAIVRASQGLPVNEMSSLTETLFYPIAESISEIQAKSKRNQANAKRKSSENERPLIEEREEEKEKNQKKEIEEKEDITSSDNTYISINRVLSSDVCAEPESDSTPADPPIITFLLNTGEEFPITQKIYDNLAEAYPAVDTMQELRKIKSWCFSNPKNRKTKGGALRFVNSWFSKEQDRGGTRASPARPPAQRRLTAEEIYNLPAISPWSKEGG